MQKGYYATALADIKSTPGWFGKLCLLALVNIIPIFGQIVVAGYLYGWAREAAWNIDRPMPAKIFGNEDGRLYSRGFFALVIAFVFSLVPEIIFALSDALSGAAVGTGTLFLYDGGVGPGLGSAVGTGVLSGIVWLIGVVAMVLVFFFNEIGAMRMTVYGRLSAGFQVGKIWRMFRHKPEGMWRIFGMYLLVSCIIFFVAFIVVMVIGLGAVVAALASDAFGSGYYAPNDPFYGMPTQAVVSSIGVGIVLLIAVVYFLLVGSVFVQALVARAMGRWTAQFQVEKWQGQDAPMPFETEQAQQPAYPGGPNAQPTWQPGSQQGQQQVPNAQGQAGAQTAWQQPQGRPQSQGAWQPPASSSASASQGAAAAQQGASAPQGVADAGAQPGAPQQPTNPVSPQPAAPQGSGLQGAAASQQGTPAVPAQPSAPASRQPTAAAPDAQEQAVPQPVPSASPQQEQPQAPASAAGTAAPQQAFAPEAPSSQGSPSPETPAPQPGAASGPASASKGGTAPDAPDQVDGEPRA